jgi:hypothetical protein
MKLWDTETGQCLQRFGNGKTPYVVRFHPDDDKQNIFLAGMSDKKIIQVIYLLASQIFSNRPISMTSTAGKSLGNMINTLDMLTRSLL